MRNFKYQTKVVCFIQYINIEKIEIFHALYVKLELLTKRRSEHGARIHG